MLTPLIRLQQGRNFIHRTAVYVIRTHGGVGGRGCEASSYPDYKHGERS